MKIEFHVENGWFQKYFGFSRKYGIEVDDTKITKQQQRKLEYELQTSIRKLIESHKQEWGVKSHEIRHV